MTQAALDRLDRLAFIMDEAFTVPGTNVRVGADAVLNLIPGAGTILSQAIACYLVVEAWRLGVPKPVLGRMVLNVGIDFGISAVPGLGWIGDIFYRANSRNMALLRDYLGQGPGGQIIDGEARVVA